MVVLSAVDLCVWCAVAWQLIPPCLPSSSHIWLGLSPETCLESAETEIERGAPEEGHTQRAADKEGSVCSQLKTYRLDCEGDLEIPTSYFLWEFVTTIGH